MKNMGDGRRVARVEREVQVVIADYLKTSPLRSLGLITVTQVRMPADFRTAKVYLSLLGEAEKQDELVLKMQEQAHEVQKFIGQQLRMRYCPKLSFVKDDTTEKVIQIEKILHEIAQDRKPINDDNGDEA
ncbi:MAG TPA: 30S ribosome-binding factor RbfA [Pseudobdellovibrionaceae bacterium]|jgi:ribosome-binding factor A|nr:30S ribosome-binding factor RbfA [Pseudobdellovibrionaceae bacterium]